MAKSATSLAIGIDLGTTNSCVGVFRDGHVEIIPNDMGSRLTPSCVAFTDEERLIGDAAKAQATWNPKNTVFEVKRLIGRKFDEVSVQNGIKYWPFTVVNHEGNPKIEVEYKNERKTYTPEEISAMVLGKMKDTAQAYLGCPVKDAVITVPAYFNDSQRQATIDAGIIAGLNVLAILNEPEAAAIAYGVDKKIQQKRNVLIYDLGGGTFDAVVMTIENRSFEVKAVGGNTNLGGGDFDNLLVKHFSEKFKTKYKIDLLKDKRASGRLRKACEGAKKSLSSLSMKHIQIESLCQGIDFSSKIRRSQLNSICGDLFSKTMDVVQTVLNESHVDKFAIHEVLLVGGSTRIPKIKDMLVEYFGAQKVSKSINPDEAVANGAAVHAAMLSRNYTVEELSLQRVTPFSLSVDNSDGTVTVIVSRNTKVPTIKSGNRTTTEDNQTAVRFKIYEGEQKMAKDNHLLGTFRLENIELAPKRVPTFELTYNIDSNGILTVTARDKKTGSTNNITITAIKGRLQKEEIERMVVEAKQLQKDEREQRDCEKFQFSLGAGFYAEETEEICSGMNGASLRRTRTSGLTAAFNMSYSF